MKLKNKKTGEIVEWEHGLQYKLGKEYNSIKEFADEWEDAPEEPKKHYEILSMGAVMEREDAEDEIFRNQGQKEIGNYFSSREEAEKAVEKLKAVKRLKDKGFKLKGWYMPKNTLNIEIDGGFPKDVSLCDVMDDLDIVFGGEE